MKTSNLVATSLAVAPAVVAGWTWKEAEGKSINFTSVPGYFIQDDAATNPTGFDYVSAFHLISLWRCVIPKILTDSQATVNFGLVNRTYPTDKRFDAAGTKTQWQRFEAWVKHLNSGCNKKPNVQYKVLFMGRHGEGWHNAAESFYGTPAWNVSSAAALPSPWQPLT